MSDNVLRKSTILCGTAFIATWDVMWPVGRRLDTPATHAMGDIDGIGVCKE